MCLPGEDHLDFKRHIFEARHWGWGWGQTYAVEYFLWLSEGLWILAMLTCSVAFSLALRCFVTKAEVLGARMSGKPCFSSGLPVSYWLMLICDHSTIPDNRFPKRSKEMECSLLLSKYGVTWQEHRDTWCVDVYVQGRSQISQWRLDSRYGTGSD